MSLPRLKKFFKNYKFTDDPVRLDAATVITDQRKFVESYMKMLEANSGNKCYIPYYRMLVRFAKKVSENENKNDQKSPSQQTE